MVLAIQANDVIHSWWVPSLGGKVDAVPGYTTYTWFKALHTGTFHGQCAQLCGRNHAAMIALVKVVSPQEYQAVGGPGPAGDHGGQQPGVTAAHVSDEQRQPRSVATAVALVHDFPRKPLGAFTRCR